MSFIQALHTVNTLNKNLKRKTGIFLKFPMQRVSVLTQDCSNSPTLSGCVTILEF